MRNSTPDISDDLYQEVIDYLETPGATKKVACQKLKINYNTKRLEKLLSDFTEGKARDKRLRAEKRKQPVTKDEVAGIITDYLTGESLDELSNRYYRSTNTIKYHIEKHGANLKHAGADELCPPMLPDLCIKDNFAVGETVWSAKYNCLAKVCAEYKGAYRVKVQSDSLNHYSYQAPEELGSIQHLLDLGVDVTRLSSGLLTNDEITMKLNESVRAANKRK